MVRGEDERGAVREDLGEVGGTVPAAGKGADAVVAAEVCESGEALGDGAMDAMLEWAGSTCVSGVEREPTSVASFRRKHSRRERGSRTR